MISRRKDFFYIVGKGEIPCLVRQKISSCSSLKCVSNAVACIFQSALAWGEGSSKVYVNHRILLLFPVPGSCLLQPFQSGQWDLEIPSEAPPDKSQGL